MRLFTEKQRGNGIRPLSGFVVLCLISALALTLTLTGCSGDEDAEKANLGNLVEVSLNDGDVYATISLLDYGDIVVKLFPEIAPLAVQQFTGLADRGFYERKTIHRVIQDLLIQGGSLNGDGTDGNVVKESRITVETSPYAKHFYGAVSMAADPNGNNFCQFYIVTSKEQPDIDGDIAKLEAQLADETLALPEKLRERYQTRLDELKALPEEVKALYAIRGGHYQFDGQNTVFGQVISGFDILDELNQVRVVTGNNLDDSTNIASKPAEPIIIENITITRKPLPEPTTTTEETTTGKSSGKKKKTTTKATEALTEVITQPGAPEETTAETQADNSETVSVDDTGDTSVPESTPQEDVTSIEDIDGLNEDSDISEDNVLSADTAMVDETEMTDSPADSSASETEASAESTVPASETAEVQDSAAEETTSA